MVPSGWQGGGRVSSNDEADDDRDTLRAPPRPAPPPIGRVSLPAVEPQPLDSTASWPPELPPPLPARPQPPPLPARVPLLVKSDPPPPNLDEIPTLRPDAMEADDASGAAAKPAPSEPFLGAREIRIPPMPVPKDLPKLLELERGGSGDSSHPSVNEHRPPLYPSTLSPAERAARWAEPRAKRERGRGRLIGGLALAAVGVVAIGASSMWQTVAEPVVPRHTTAATAATNDTPARVPVPVPAVLPSTAPTPPAVAPLPEPAAVAAREQPESTPTPTATPALPRALPVVKRKLPAPTPVIDPATLPETPSRDAVIEAIAPLREEIARCSEGRGGIAEIMLTVDGSGAVRHASLVGDYAGTKQGSCIALAARKARFSPFRQERFSVRYPVAL
jgi:hypothetical protein